MNSLQALSNTNKTLTFREAYNPPQASYVSRRSLDKVIPITGSSQYDPSSTRRISWRLPAGSFCDVNDLFFSFKLKLALTEATDKVYNWSGTHTLFERLTINIGGVVAEDIVNYNVIEEMIHRLTGNDDYVNSPLGMAQGYNPVRDSQNLTEDLTNGTEYIFKPRLSGLLNNDKMLCLPYLPEVVIELYLASPETVFHLQQIDESDPDNVVYSPPLGTANYSLNDVALNAPFVEYDKDFIMSFEASLNNTPLKYHFNTFSNFVATVDASSDVAIGSFRTDIKSVFAGFRNANVGDIKTNSFKFIRSDIERYQMSLGTQKYPLEPVSVGARQQAKSITYLTQCVSNIQDTSLGMNINYKDWDSADAKKKGFWCLGMDMSNSDSLLGGIDSTLSFGSPLLLSLTGEINKCRADAFVHFSSILTILPDRSVLVTF